MNTDDRRTRFIVQPFSAVITTAIFAPGAALAEPLFQVPLYGRDIDMTRWETNYVEAGVGYNDVSGDGYGFGQYTGLYKSEAFANINMNLANRDTSNGSYTNLWGLNLGLPSRQAAGGLGTQGKWGLNAEFDQITNYQTNSASFIFDGLGSSFLTLPTGFQGITAGNSQPPANAANILPFEQPFPVKVARDFFKTSASVAFGVGWELTGNYNYQNRDGAKLTGAAIGGGAGNSRAAIVPYAIDDNTNQFEAALKYASPRTQFSLGYWYSRYANNNNSLTWQNPYGMVSGWQPGAGVGFSTGFGRISLDPDNEFQQFKVDYGYNFTPVTRLAATVQHSEGKQDQAFLPYSINQPPLVSPGLSAPIGLPQNSLDGKIDTTRVDLTLTARPAARLFLKVGYSYNDRDNKTPASQYLFLGGDALNQPVVPPGGVPNQVNALQIRTNLPFGTTENKFIIDGDYNLGRGTAVRGWYQYRKTDYKVASEQSRADSNDNEVGIELKSRANEVINGNLKYVWHQRRGAEYDTNAEFAASVTPATLAARNFLQLPTVRYFYNSDYTQNEVKALVSFTPASPLSAQLDAHWWRRNYDGPDCGGPNDQLLLNQIPPLVFPSQCAGLLTTTGQAYTLDGQYTVSYELSFTAYYTWLQNDQNQAGRSFAATAQGSPNIAFAVDPNRNWSANPKSTDNMFGIGVNWKPEDKPYEVGLQYLYIEGKTAIGTEAGPALVAPTAIPNVNTTQNSLQVFGKWQYSKNVLLRANYWFQRFRSSNWAFDNATPVSSNGVLLTGQKSSEYTANVFGISVAYTGL